jgi:hypothetical protein
MGAPIFVTGTGWASQVDQSFDCTVSGLDVSLIVSVLTTNANVTAVTYGGQSLVLAGSSVNYYGVYVYYLQNPPSGTNTIHQTGALSGAIHALVYRNCRNVSAFGTGVGVNGSGSDTFTPSVTIGSDIGSVVFSAAYHRRRNAGNMAPADGQTERVETAGSGGDYEPGLMSGEEVGASSVVTGQWTGAAAGAQAETVAVSVLGTASSSRLVKLNINVKAPIGIIDDQGAVVRPAMLRPDNWMELGGLIRPSGKVYDSLVKDPRLIYLEGVDFTAPDGITAQGGREDLGQTILARITRGSLA